MTLLNAASKVFVGSAEANSVYRGTELIYEKATIPPYSYSPMQAPTYDPPAPLQVVGYSDVPSMKAEMISQSQLRVSWETSVVQTGFIGLIGWGDDDGNTNPHPLVLDGKNYAQFKGVQMDFVEAPVIPPGVFVNDNCLLLWITDYEDDSSGIWEVSSGAPWPQGGKYLDFAANPPIIPAPVEGNWGMMPWFNPYATAPAGSFTMTLPWLRYIE